MRVLILLLGFTFLACSSPSELEEMNGCGADLPDNLTEKTDFKKNFKLQLPSPWKTSYYYSPSTSEMFAADTTKQLTESYIVELIHQDAELELGSDLKSKIDSFNKDNNYSLVDSNELQFKNHPAAFFTLKGKKNNYDVLIFDLYVKTSEVSYFNSKIEIYGNSNIQNRLCESLAILNTIEFLK